MSNQAKKEIRLLPVLQVTTGSQNVVTIYFSIFIINFKIKLK